MKFINGLLSNKERIIHLETLTLRYFVLVVAFIILTLWVYLFMKAYLYKLSSLLYRTLEDIVLECCLDR